MPGIYGLANCKELGGNLSKMTDALHLYDHFHQERVFTDRRFGASQVHASHKHAESCLIDEGGDAIWVEGEAYNVDRVAKYLGSKAASLSELILEAERNDELERCLHLLDGYFCAALYCSERQKIKLISDRYGMRLLYWYHRNGSFIWGSEVKAILAVSEVDKKLDYSSYESFMRLGHLTSDSTWFAHIKLMKPAAIVEYDLSSNRSTQHHYWKWSDIPTLNLTFDESVDALGHRFLHAVAKRFIPTEKNAISLSGGLDSRAIFAAVDQLFPEYEGYAYTFGVPNSDDTTIAESVVARSKFWSHEKLHLSSDNWLDRCNERVWNTDGMLDLMHMHGGECAPYVGTFVDVNLNGYLGDAVLGGSYLKPRKYSNIPINEKIALGAYGVFGRDFCDEFYCDINHYDHYFFMTRGRRFINHGTVNLLPWVDQRKPFFDNGLVELVFGLPDEYRAYNRLYSTMLQRFFPKYFRDIPWQQTGKPAARLKLSDKVKRKSVKAVKSFLGFQSNSEYTDYPSWIRKNENFEKLDIILGREDAMYKAFTSDNMAEKLLHSHVEKRFVDNSSEICRLATIELYLKNVYEKI